MSLFIGEDQVGTQNVVLTDGLGSLVQVWGTVWVTTPDVLGTVLTLQVFATAANGYVFQHDYVGGPGGLVVNDLVSYAAITFNFFCNHGGGASALEVVLGGSPGSAVYNYIFETKYTF